MLNNKCQIVEGVLYRLEKVDSTLLIWLNKHFEQSIKYSFWSLCVEMLKPIKSEFSEDYHPQKINLVRWLRLIDPTLNLREAKELVDQMITDFEEFRQFCALKF